MRLTPEQARKIKDVIWTSDYAYDQRLLPPDYGQRRNFEFAWHQGVRGESYADASLRKSLSWQNLGNRLGLLFRDPSAELLDAAYEYAAELGKRPSSGGAVVVTRPKRLDEIVQGPLVEPTGDEYDLDERTDKLTAFLDERERKGDLPEPPAGVLVPEQIRGSSSGFVRSPAVRGWVLHRARGNCENCGLPAPFKTETGRPYLEVHHLVTLAEGGPDIVANTVAVCPNCHRRLHLGVGRAAETAVLVARWS